MKTVGLKHLNRLPPLSKHPPMPNNLSDKVLLAASYGFSGLCLVWIMGVNYNIAAAYHRVDGKTKVIFGVVELSFIDQYWLLIPIATALLLGVSAYRKRRATTMAIVAILFAGGVGVLLFSRVWRFML